MIATDQRFAAVMLTIAPTLDVISDVAYFCPPHSIQSM